jgi:hypothetical protein
LSNLKVLEGISMIDLPEMLGRVDGGGSLLRCPVCGVESTHTVGAYTRVGSDDGEAEVYRWTQAVGTTSERRSALVVELRCEEQHRFGIVFQQHKGQTFLATESLSDYPSLVGSSKQAPFEAELETLRNDAQVRLLQIEQARLQGQKAVVDPV